MSNDQSNPTDLEKEPKRTIHDIHLVEWIFETLFSAAVVFFATDANNPDVKGSEHRLLFASATAGLVILYKLSIRLIPKKIPINGKSFVRLLVIHLPIPLALLALSIFVLPNYLTAKTFPCDSLYTNSIFVLIGIGFASAWLSQFFGWRHLSGSSALKWRDRFVSTLLGAYQTKDLGLIYSALSFLRFSFVSLVLLVSTYQIGSLSNEPCPPLLWALPAFIYLVYSWILFACSNQVNQRAIENPETQSQSKHLISGILFWPAVVDTLAIAGLSCTVDPHPKDYHLFYIIPLFASWLFNTHKNMIAILCLVNLCIVIETVVHLRIWTDNFTFQLLSEAILTAGFWSELSGVALPKLVFWTLVYGLMLGLRLLRAEETKQRRLIDAVSDSVPYDVFAKDKDSKFLYINKRLFDNFDRIISPAVKSKHSLKQRSDYYGKTDFEIGLAHASQYSESDSVALSGRVWDDLEPNYDPEKVEIPFINTTKTPFPFSSLQNSVGDAGERPDVEMIVGLSANGTPRLISETMADLGPFYATLKNKSKHIRWANKAFCDRDVDPLSIIRQWKAIHPKYANLATTDLIRECFGDKFRIQNEDLYNKVESVISGSSQAVVFSSEEKLTFLLLMHQGHGAKDEDLYGITVAGKFQRSDEDVIQQALRDFENGDDPVACAIERGAFQEAHIFVVGSKPANVQVFKLPWMISNYKNYLAPSSAQSNIPKSEMIRGVAVFFQEIQSQSDFAI